MLEKYIVNFNKKTQEQTDLNLFLNEVPYYFMILTNLSLTEEGQKKFLNIENENIKGIVFMKVLDKFFEYIYNEEFNFCSSLLANISSIKEGRQMILEFKIFKIFLLHMDRLNNFKITNMLRMIRNCAFEFETFKEELLVNDAKLFSLLIKILILANVTEKKIIVDTGIKHIDEIYFTHFKQEIAFNEKEVINDLIIDIFLTLTNDEGAVLAMKEKGLYKALTYVKNNSTKDENLNDRLFVITNYLEN